MTDQIEKDHPGGVTGSEYSFDTKATPVDEVDTEKLITRVAIKSNVFKIICQS
jgi:hypothetical protein